jgi:hypothetical protein
MLETERNQPMRVCAGAGQASQRRLGASKGTVVLPRASSPSVGRSTSAWNVAEMLGNADRCSQPVSRPEDSSAASIR